MNLLLFGIARQRLLLPSGKWLDLRPESEWRRLVSSLKRHIPLTRPPLLRGHEDGTARGRVTAVVGPVSREQLIRGGVDPRLVPHPEYVLFRATLNGRGKADHRLGDIAMTSIGLGLDVPDDTGRVHPYFLEELSLVDRPHVRVQPDAESLSRVTLRAGARHVIRLSGGVITRRVQMTMDEKLAQVRDLIQQLAAVLGDDVPPMDEPEEMAVDTADAVAATLAGDDDYDKEEMSALRRKIESLEAERAKERVALQAERFAVQIDRAGIRCSADERAALIEACLGAPGKAEALIRLAAPKGGTHRLAASGGPEEPAGTLQERAIRALRRDAAQRAAGGGA